MKIAILLLIVVGLSYVSASTSCTGLCLDLEVEVRSTIQPKAQSFNIDMKNIKGVEFKANSTEFLSGTHIPLSQVGLTLTKKTPGEELDSRHHKYLRNTENSVWLPYSYCGQWGRTGYSITNQMVRTSSSKEEFPLVSFKFVFDPDLKNISEDDMNAILNTLKVNTNKRIEVKKEIKKYISDHQDDYLEATNTIKQMRDKNKDIDKQIAENEKKLQKENNQIREIEKEIKKLNDEVAAKTKDFKEQDSILSNLDDNLKELEKKLKIKKNELNNLKPSDISTLQEQIKQAAPNMRFSDRAPKEYKIEYQISVPKKREYVNKNYQTCDGKAESVNKCLTQTESKAQLRKKLRREF